MATNMLDALLHFHTIKLLEKSHIFIHICSLDLFKVLWTRRLCLFVCMHLYLNLWILDISHVISCNRCESMYLTFMFKMDT